MGSHRFAACLHAVLLLATLAACRGSRLPLPRVGPTDASRARPLAPAVRQPGANRPPAQPANLPTHFDDVRGRRVALSNRDLAPVDAWLSARNTQWILGDHVDVYASKEYFSSMLTMNARVGLVHRSDAQVDGDTVSTLRYIGRPGSQSAMTTPRVQVGTGLSISARKVLRVRMAKTSDPARPVQLRIVARGSSVQGRHETVEYRHERIELGGALRRSSGRWYWIPFNR